MLHSATFYRWNHRIIRFVPIAIATAIICTSNVRSDNFHLANGVIDDVPAISEEDWFDEETPYSVSPVLFYLTTLSAANSVSDDLASEAVVESFYSKNAARLVLPDTPAKIVSGLSELEPGQSKIIEISNSAKAPRASAVSASFVEFSAGENIYEISGWVDGSVRSSDSESVAATNTIITFVLDVSHVSVVEIEGCKHFDITAFKLAEEFLAEGDACSFLLDPSDIPERDDVINELLEEADISIYGEGGSAEPTRRDPASFNLWYTATKPFIIGQKQSKGKVSFRVAVRRLCAPNKEPFCRKNIRTDRFKRNCKPKKPPVFKNLIITETARDSSENIINYEMTIEDPVYKLPSGHKSWVSGNSNFLRGIPTQVEGLKGFYDQPVRLVRFFKGERFEKRASGYGRGTTKQDKRSGNVTLGFHEACHIESFISSHKAGLSPPETQRISQRVVDCVGKLPKKTWIACKKERSLRRTGAGTK